MRQQPLKIEWITLLTLALGQLAQGSADASGIYTVTDLYGMGGGLGSAPSINNRGQVVGSYTPTNSLNSYPLIYDSGAGGRVTIVGMTSPSGGNSGSYGATGSLLGTDDRGQYLEYSWSGSGTSGTTKLISHGQVATINQNDVPRAINRAGQILFQTSSTEYPQFAELRDSYVEQNGTATRIPSPPGSSDAEAVAINNRGMIAVDTTNLTNPTGTGPNGSPTGPSVAEGHAFLLNGSTWTDLGTLGGPASQGTAINANGTVVGWSQLDGQTTHAMMVPFGKAMIDLGTLPGDKTSFAEAVNKFGQAVGFSFAVDGGLYYHGFLYENGVMEDLNSLLPPGSGLKITDGIAINDRGQILAEAIWADGDHDGLVLLSPAGIDVAPPVYPALPITTTPEPTTLTFFGLIAVTLGWHKLRRRSHGGGR